MRIDPAIQGALAGIRSAETVQKFRKAAQGVEQIFVKQLLEQMRKSMPGTEGNSYGMQMYEDMMNDALAAAVAQRGDFGIADQMRAAMEPRILREEWARLEMAARTAGTKQELER